jgi:predicted RNA-binding protein YlxR (DUF448 family)
MLPKRTLTRVSMNKAGEIAPDEGQKAPGRGAYVCGSPECRAKFVKVKALSRAFKREVSREVYERVTDILLTIDN